MTAIMELIQSDQHIIIQRQGQIHVHRLPKNPAKKWAVKIGRNKVDIASAIGKPYGIFKITNNQGGHSFLEPTDNVTEIKKELLKDVNAGEDNQDIWDDGTAQQLKQEDIDQLKVQGISGTEIVSQLMENSKTFQNRTEFSQEKYLTKKEEKYSDWLEILVPTVRLLAKYYHTQDSMKILNLRPDTLAVMLSMANIKCGGSYGVLDGGCQGIISAAILDRIQGQGVVWNLTTNGKPQNEVINAMNFTKEQIQPYRNVNLFKLKESLEKKKDVDEEAPAAKIPRLDGDDAKLELGTLDGLIIAYRRPNAIAKELLKLLAPSQNFAIFCPYIEPLSETYMQLRESNSAVGLKLVELWHRNYQVLPLRSHPEVMMNGSGGFLLSGIKVVSA